MNALAVAAGCLAGLILAAAFVAPFAIYTPRCRGGEPSIYVGGALHLAGCDSRYRCRGRCSRAHT